MLMRKRRDRSAAGDEIIEKLTKLKVRAVLKLPLRQTQAARSIVYWLNRRGPRGFITKQTNGLLHIWRTH